MSDWEKTLREDQGHAGKTVSTGWPGNAMKSFRKSWKRWLCKEILDVPDQSVSLETKLQNMCKIMDRWIMDQT